MTQIGNALATHQFTGSSIDFQYLTVSGSANNGAVEIRPRLLSGGDRSGQVCFGHPQIRGAHLRNSIEGGPSGGELSHACCPDSIEAGLGFYHFFSIGSVDLGQISPRFHQPSTGRIQGGVFAVPLRGRNRPRAIEAGIAIGFHLGVG